MTRTTDRRRTVPSRAPQGASPDRRLLVTATKLFAIQGIRAVGIDRVLAEAGVAKASLYGHYGSKDGLVLAYLNDLDQRDRKRYRQAAAELADALDRILLFFDLAQTAATKRRFRGCLYANAATEYPGVDLQPVLAHREWFRETVTALLAEAGAADSAELARDIQLLYDGGLLGSKVERSTAPINRARGMAADLINRARR